MYNKIYVKCKQLLSNFPAELFIRRPGICVELFHFGFGKFQDRFFPVDHIKCLKVQMFRFSLNAGNKGF